MNRLPQVPMREIHGWLSGVFKEGEVQSVETLIKCIVIASGNDASGNGRTHLPVQKRRLSESDQRCKELGMNHTHFEDCCGLTESENHYTTAYDVALMSRELILYPKNS